MPGEWHTEWQSYFNDREKTIYNDNFTTLSKRRRADVLLSNYVIEFQNSKITIEEVEARKKDWSYCGKKIIWVINGNHTCVVSPKNNGFFLITVEYSWWKAENFQCHDIVFFDIDGKIYIIEPNNIKSLVVQTSAPYSKDNFIKMLKEDDMRVIDKLNNKYIDHRPTVHIKQEGAGNGKTYGIIQLLQNNDYRHYETFIYLTKQHSAVNVIYQELQDQTNRGDLCNINIINDNTDNKKHIIIYNNLKTQKKCKIIIGTIDSFKWTLGDKTITGIDKFKTIVNDIIKNDIRAGKDGYIHYTANGVKLNMKTLIIGDEMQDLHPEYTKALVKIAIERGVDFYAVGDKLQSITNEKNAFTFLTDELKEDETIRIIRHSYKNVCRRFSDSELIDFVNTCVPFEKYNLPQIENKKKKTNIKSIDFFKGVWIDPNAPSHDNVDLEADKIMEKYRYEVNTHNRKPNDFLFVTPFVNKNPLLDEVNTKIREFWREKYNDNTDYIKYSIFHKSENGTSIDLTQSTNSTRIVSIHSSKGDGRPIVFVIGLTESALLRYTNENKSLIFNSLLHVSITRQKEKLYFRYEGNGDKIYNLINKYFENNNNIIKPIFTKSKNVSLKKLLSHNRENNFDILFNKIISVENLDNLSEKSDGKKMLIDMQHHCIRYGVFSMLIKLYLLSNSIKIKQNPYDEPIYQVLNKLQAIMINPVSAGEYYKLIKYKYPKKKGIFPIIKLTNGDKYEEYFNFFVELIERVKRFIASFLKTGLISGLDLEWIELVCLYYLMEVYDNGVFSNISIDDIYDIIDIYLKCSVKDKEMYLENHYEKIIKTEQIVSKFLKENPNLTYLLNHPIHFHGNNDDFGICHNFELIGYNETNVVVLEIKPQFNSLNYNDVVYESIFKTFQIIKTKKDKNSKLLNKTIKSVVLTYDNDCEPFYIEYNNIIRSKFKDVLELYKTNMLTHFELEHNKIFNFFLYYKSMFKDEPFMVKLINDYKTNDKKSYEYVVDIFRDMKREEKKKGIIQIDENIFSKKMLDNLEESIEDFFD